MKKTRKLIFKSVHGRWSSNGYRREQRVTLRGGTRPIQLLVLRNAPSMTPAVMEELASRLRRCKHNEVIVVEVPKGARFTVYEEVTK